MLWLLGAGVLLYVFIYIIALIILDCDLQLFFYEKFGKPIGALRGKVVFITGASSGIGEQLAYALAKHGVKLVLASRRLPELERVKRQCLLDSNNALADSDILTIEMDVLDFGKHETYWRAAVEHFAGGVDVLVNNAGRSQRAMWERIDAHVDREMFELNVFASVNLTRCALKYFAEAKRKGHVVAVSSVAGLFGLPHSASYTGSKHALHGYMNSLRNEKLADGIDVTVLCPGPVFTNFLQNSFTEKRGECFGVKVQAHDKRMTAERCAELCAISIANRLQESWMALFPFLPMIYCSVYHPHVFNILMRLIGANGIYKLRDNRKLHFD